MPKSSTTARRHHPIPPSSARANRSGSKRGSRSYRHSSQSSVSKRVLAGHGSTGAAVSHYAVGRTIGEGTFGKVKKGIHKLTGVPVAIKILEKDKIVDLADVERVKREIHILTRINHPNVIRLYEVIDSPKHIFLIMEFAPGGELFDHIVASGRVKEKEACRFFHHIVNGVDYCHHKGIIHRDLKPENLLLDKITGIKIVDFGLGNLAPDGALLKTACGSPCYAAPEMIAGKRYFGPGVDMWSLGVILFALICGYLPFEDPNTAKLYEKIMGGVYEIPDFISQGGRDLITRLLCTDPKRRFTVEQVRTHPWYASQTVKTDPHLLQSSSKLDDPAFSAFYEDYTPDGTMVVDQDIIRHMVMIGYNPNQVHESITSAKHDHFAATYSLLLVKRRLALLAGEAPPQHHSQPASHPVTNAFDRPPHAAGGRNTKIPPLGAHYPVPPGANGHPHEPRPPSHPSSAGGTRRARAGNGGGGNSSSRRSSRPTPPRDDSSGKNGAERPAKRDAFVPRPPTTAEPTRGRPSNSRQGDHSRHRSRPATSHQNQHQYHNNPQSYNNNNSNNSNHAPTHGSVSHRSHRKAPLVTRGAVTAREPKQQRDVPPSRGEAFVEPPLQSQAQVGSSSAANRRANKAKTSNPPARRAVVTDDISPPSSPSPPVSPITTHASQKKHRHKQKGAASPSKPRAVTDTTTTTTTPMRTAFNVSQASLHAPREILSEMIRVVTLNGLGCTMLNGADAAVSAANSTPSTTKANDTKEWDDSDDELEIIKDTGTADRAELLPGRSTPKAQAATKQHALSSDDEAVKHVLECTKGPSRFQMKITPLTLPGNKRVHVVRIKNLTGAQWMYKELCTRLIPQFNL